MERPRRLHAREALVAGPGSGCGLLAGLAIAACVGITAEACRAAMAAWQGRVAVRPRRP